MPALRRTRPWLAAALVASAWAAHASDPTLPDLSGSSDADVIADNVHAMAALEYAALLEQLKFFSAADKVAHQFQTGELPLPDAGTGAGHLVLQYQRARAAAPSADARHRLYEGARALVASDVAWRELSAAFAELRAPARQRAAVAQIKRFLALAARAGKPARPVAHALSAWTAAALELLDSPEVQRAEGVRDRAALIERLAGPPAPPPSRLAVARARREVLAWLASALSRGPHAVPARILEDARHLVEPR